MRRKQFIRLGLLAPLGGLLHLPAARGAVAGAVGIATGEVGAVAGETGVAAGGGAAPLHIGDVEFPIVDLHCHPSLKMYLWQEHLWGRHCPRPGSNPIAMQLDTRELGHGYVKGMLGAHYLVEAAAVQQWDLLKKLYPWIQRLWRPLTHKIEHEDASNFTQINIMIDTLENQVWLVNQRQSNIEFVIARSFTEFKAIADAPGKIAIAHAIEGGHALGRNFPISEKRKQLYLARPARQHKFAIQAGQPDAYPYIRNLEALHARGVCLMTIAHLFPNDLAYPCEGISADEKKNIGFAWNYDPVASNLGLTEVGKAVVRHMLEIGMVVDLTHCTPACRKDVFGIADDVNAGRKDKGLPPRPVAFTHVGLQSIFTKYDHREELKNYRFYDIDPEEIKAICRCNGIIGVIPENFWLVGADKKIQGADIEPRDYSVGIGYLIETMEAINALTDAKDFSNIGIGTDFDGLADAPNDLYVPRMLGGLINAIRAMPGITDAQVRGITSGNAYRVLENGWG